MSQPVLTLDATSREAVVARYNHTDDPETRSRCQMVLLAADRGLNAEQIAPLVLRSHDTVRRVLLRFAEGGLAALPRGKGGGHPPTVTPAWKAELERVIERDPHTCGVERANWTTGLLADYLVQQTGIAVGQETVRDYLHRLGYVCKRPTWTLEHKASAREDYVGNACGWRFC